MRSYYFVFCKGDIMLERVADGTFTIPLAEEPPVPTHEWTNILSVGTLGEYAVKTYSIDMPVVDNPRYEMCGLRPSYYKLSPQLYQRAGKCEELIYWDKNTKFCGVCGGQMKMQTEISKKCEHCGKQVWPSLATAVIVRINRGEEVLLVHARNFKGDFFSLVAGFVETGETLEEAVKREVMEETGLTIKNIRYFASQPWPYPSGLMIGFTAEYESGELKLQREELSAGSWFTRDNLPQMPEKLSIARRLIDDWLLSPIQP